MLVTLGARRDTTDVVDLLHGCHDRIRRFTELAARLAGGHGEPLDEVRAAATQVRRYFTEAFPLHVADEDDVIAPRLAGTRAEVDRALARMAADHAAHAPAIERLNAALAVLARDPARRPIVAIELAATTAELQAILSPHLALEEAVIFPAVRQLPVRERVTIRDAIRARRATSAAP